jgi:hypothetical protein
MIASDSHFDPEVPMKKTATAFALIATLALAGPAAAAKAPKYKGKTKEGTKVSFVLSGKKHQWVDQFRSSVPTTCVSAQGGNPRVFIHSWSPPYKYLLGYAAKVKYTDPYTTTYKISTKRVSKKKIKGKLSLNYSMLANNTFGGYHILTCYGTASFTAKTR